jgi:hypothetical protein
MFVLNEIRLLAHYPLIVVIDLKTYQMWNKRFFDLFLSKNSKLNIVHIAFLSVMRRFPASNSLEILSLNAMFTRVHQSSFCPGAPWLALAGLEFLGSIYETPFPHSQNCVAFYTIQNKSEKKYSCYDIIRDGLLDIWGGGGGVGNFSVHEFFFIPQLLARNFFSATFLCTIFFLRTT